MGIGTSGGEASADYAEHTETYGGFLRLTRVAIVFLVLLLGAMAYFLV